ncbi:DUF6261 family protein [Parabacteroides sp. ZJ-118]|uniref:DUF6261 family protein n=1 Tax=Parabacteroides sp. ZJ-118 TaxID=2709398 RepID=UPI0013EE183A|nr:DUF6261 family protein [Parabacteroides sp. ZJ-118]
MGTFTLIPPMSLGNLNKAEKLSLLKRFMKLMPAGPADSGSPDELSAQDDDGVPALNISADQVTRMNAIIDGLTELTMQASSSEETPEMQQVEADRDTTGNYIVRRVLDYPKLPLAAERTAAQRMEPALRGYRDFANLPTAQETEVINGLLTDLAKPEFADSVATLQLAPYIAELRRLNDRYAELTAQRDKSRSERADSATSKELTAEAQDLLDDMCALANASSLLQPSEEARVFVRDATHLFAQVRTAYKQRSKGTPPAAPGTPEPGEGEEPASPDEIAAAIAAPSE